MTTFYVPYQINQVNNLPGFIQNPSPIAWFNLVGNLVNGGEGPTTTVTAGNIMFTGTILNVEIGYVLVFALTDLTIEELESVPVSDWHENIWNATREINTNGNDPVNLWVGLKLPGESVVAGDFASALITVQDNFGLIEP